MVVHWSGVVGVLGLSERVEKENHSKADKLPEKDTLLIKLAQDVEVNFAAIYGYAYSIAWQPSPGNS
jgi:hypothetical protein